MAEETIRRVFEASDEKVRETDCSFHRFLYNRIDWDVRTLALTGPKGVGKTTMFLQYLKEHPKIAESSLYISLDDIWVDQFALYDLVKYHVQHGGTRVFLDEIHYLKDWPRLVKSLYDSFRNLRIAYTGSSILQLKESAGDLSRRQVEYFLPGLSFREYLKLEGVGDFKPVDLKSLLSRHVGIAESVVKKIRVLPHFERYLRGGYYPFYREDKDHYWRKLVQVVNQVLERDLPLVEDVSMDTIRKSRRMLTILAESTPQTPNITRLSRDLGMDRKQGLKMLHRMARAGLLGLLAEDADALKYLGSPNKIFCENPNLMYALTARPDKGTLRESFFNNQVGTMNLLAYPKRGDFIAEGRWLFEVGGAGKTFEQIKDAPDSFLAVDETEVGRGARIPLWLFGFLY